MSPSGDKRITSGPPDYGRPERDIAYAQDEAPAHSKEGVNLLSRITYLTAAPSGVRKKYTTHHRVSLAAVFRLARKLQKEAKLLRLVK